MPPMGRRARAAAVFGGALALGGCGGDYGAPEPGTKQAGDVVQLWRTELLIATVLGVVVLALIAWCVVRYRKRPDDDGTLPPQRAGNIPLEVFYTAIPVLIVAGLFAYNLVLSHRVDKVGKADLTITVTGFQWQWRFDYRAQDVSVLGDVGNIPTMVLPAGRTVRLELRATDVIHSFFVPGFLVKRDLIPGVENTIEISPTRTGTYLGHCAEFCGLDHARMNFDVRIVAPDEFDAWVRATRNGTGA